MWLLYTTMYPFGRRKCRKKARRFRVKGKDLVPSLGLVGTLEIAEQLRFSNHNETVPFAKERLPNIVTS